MTDPAWMMIGGLLLAEATPGDGLGVFVTNPNEVMSRSVRTTDSPNPTTHGLIYGSDLLDGRKFTLDIAIVVDDPDAIMGLVEPWMYVLSPTNLYTELRIKLPGIEERVMTGRPRNLDLDISEIYNGIAQIKVEFVCADPRMYSPNTVIQSMFTALRADGFGFPLTFPLTFAENYDDLRNQATVEVNGNTPPPYVVTFHPSANPKLTHVGTGAFLQLLTSFDTGIVVLDSLSRTVLYYPSGGMWGDSESVYGWLSADSRWFDLDVGWPGYIPGVNALLYEELSGDPNAHVDFQYRDAWI